MTHADKEGLAEERTVAAWVRTGLAALIGGLGTITDTSPLRVPSGGPDRRL